ncbi:glycosyltransferase [Candidatus Hadarchaeum sp.]|uniref:glycosyltransferase n=1 Tax=Candidatus Hadarchaeum sp. TaxID=2883567 RepID=UPI00319E1D10
MNKDKAEPKFTDRKPKVVILIRQLGISEHLAGGAERVTVRLANALARKDVAVNIVTLYPNGIYMAELSSKVCTYHLNANNWIKALPRLIAVIRRLNPDCIIAHDARASLAAYVSCKFLARRLPVVGVVHSVLSHRWHSCHSLIRFAYRYLARWIYHKIDTIVAVSESVASDLIKALAINPKKIEVIYNPVIEDDIFLKAKDVQFFTSTHYILGAGRLVESKGFDTLLRAFAIVRKNIVLELVILGDGPERENLENLARALEIFDNVRFLGFTRNPYPFITNASVFVLPSRWEGLPSVLIEALALGVPIVSTDCPGGAAEILEYGRWGRLVPVDDHMALANAIIDTLRNPFPPAPEAAWKRFSCEESSCKYLALIAKLQHQQQKPGERK